MDTGSFQRSSEEQQLWASLALEQLAKWALGSVSLTLIVDPTVDGGGEMLRAAGLAPRSDSGLRTATAKTVFVRCAAAFPPFSSTEANKIAGNRNDYIHGSAIGFTSIPAARWWQEYWAQAAILLAARDTEISELVGTSRAAHVDRILEAHKDYIQRKWTALKEASLQNLRRKNDGLFNLKELSAWEARSDLHAGLEHRASYECPSCGGLGALEGNPEIDRPDIEWDDDGEPYATVEVSADYFSCSTCHLILDSYELIDAAGLPTSFQTEVDAMAYFEPGYGND